MTPIQQAELDTDETRSDLVVNCVSVVHSRVTCNYLSYPAMSGGKAFTHTESKQFYYIVALCPRNRSHSGVQKMLTYNIYDAACQNQALPADPRSAPGCN